MSVTILPTKKVVDPFQVLKICSTFDHLNCVGTVELYTRLDVYIRLQSFYYNGDIVSIVVRHTLDTFTLHEVLCSLCFYITF